jgi:PAS domain S-box-containing protein
MVALTPEDVGLGPLFWQIRDAVIVGDPVTGEIALWNPGAEALFGYAEAEILGQRLEVLIPERLRTAHREGLTRYLSTGHGAVIDSPQPVEVPAKRRDGSEFWIELRLSPVEAPAAPQDSTPRPLVLAILRDCTERKQLEAERALKAQLEGILLTARTFEHELNNKLATVTGYAELLSGDPTLPVHLRTRAARAAQGGAECARIIRRLLEITEVNAIDWAGTGHTTIDVSDTTDA